MWGVFELERHNICEGFVYLLSLKEGPALKVNVKDTAVQTREQLFRIYFLSIFKKCKWKRKGVDWLKRLKVGGLDLTPLTRNTSAGMKAPTIKP